jgi:hypothetical protein
MLWLSLPIMVGFTLLGGEAANFPGLACPGLLGHGDAAGGAGGGLAAAAASPGAAVAMGVRLFLATLLGPGATASPAGSTATAGGYSLWGGFVPVEQDGSTELIDTSQLRRRFEPA